MSAPDKDAVKVQPVELILGPELLVRPLDNGKPLGEAMEELARGYAGIHNRLTSHSDWPLGWMDFDALRANLVSCRKLADEVAANNDELVVCGIGGSALGTQALESAIAVTRHDDKRFRSLYILDNIDPGQLSGASDAIDWERTAINVISKSGTTLETMADFVSLLWEFTDETVGDFNSALSSFTKSRAHFSPHKVIATTDPHQGILREWAKREGWHTLPVPTDVGGRFSVFTPVGLFPLAFSGWNVEELIEGAAEWQASALAVAPRDNIAFKLAAMHFLIHTRGGSEIAAQYVYGDSIVGLSEWFRQLWAESLAKAVDLDGRPAGRCQTPTIARGTTDQHSQNQLYMEGPDNKLFAFITCRNWPADSDICSRFEVPAELSYLKDFSASDLMEASRVGTRDALIEAGRPVYELFLADLSERTLGAYMQMWMLATAYAGLLYNVNPFDQPGVERSKVLAKAELERMRARRGASS